MVQEYTNISSCQARASKTDRTDPAIPTAVPDDLQNLFESNRRWAAATLERDADFFTRLRDQQMPRYLWIGCADSRVPANEIVGLAPGELFVHRNVANVVVHSDLNCLSVIQFAVDLLEVEHVIVVGHYGCSGVQTAMLDRRVGLADNWLRHVQDVRDADGDWLASLADDAVRHDAMCELNVLAQVENVCETTVLKDAWARGQAVAVHGWVYGLETGLLADLGATIDRSDDAKPVHARAVQAVRARYGRMPA